MPLAYFVARRWLEDFAYRIEITWGIFLLAGSTALRAALSDPVKALRYE